MANFLESLRDTDQARLLKSAERKHFEPESKILREGDTRPVLFVLRSGEARVERNHGEYQVEIARLAAGDIFGEMSFVEGFEASASIVADEPCEVDVISAKRLKTLIAGDPGLYGRFYQSLANTLSLRLRESSARNISDYAWGGNEFEAPSASEPEASAAGWGGGNPFTDPP